MSETFDSIFTALADGEERPFLNLYARDLKKIADDNSTNPEILLAILSEASLRVFKNPKSSATDVKEFVEKLVEPILKDLPPEPDYLAQRGKKGIDPKSWPSEGLLKHMGYRVGNQSPSEAARRKILRNIFEGPVPNVISLEYMAQWGNDLSYRRLYKAAWSIFSFAQTRIRRQDGERDKAIDDWAADLAWLKREFYDGKFGFAWPELDDFQ